MIYNLSYDRFIIFFDLFLIFQIDNLFFYFFIAYMREILFISSKSIYIYIYICQYFNYQLNTENIKGILHKDNCSQFMKPEFNRSV